MPESETPVQRKRLGKIVSPAIPVAALFTGLLVINETTRYPRTDDAEVFANFIGIAPQVDGPIATLPVEDNEFVKQGGLLFEIDPRPYEYALQRARSDLSTLEGQIVDQSRTIASQESAVGAARANTQSTAANVDHAASAVHEAEANVASARRNWIARKQNFSIPPIIFIASSRCLPSSSSLWTRWIRPEQQW